MSLMILSTGKHIRARELVYRDAAHWFVAAHRTQLLGYDSTGSEMLTLLCGQTLKSSLDRDFCY
jgi:prophage antirepressor-like protein